jgi:hypothetical protein
MHGGRWSRSEIYSSEEVELWVGTTRSGFVGLAAVVLTLAAIFLFGFPAAGLRNAVDLGWGFWGPAVFLVAVTLGCSDSSMTGWGGGFGLWGDVVVALTTRSPWTTSFHSSPRSTCSAEGPVRWAFGVAGWPVAALFWPRSGGRFARAAFASSHFTQPR